MDSFRMNRRDFLKATAAAGALISAGPLAEKCLVPAAEAKELQGTQIIETNCRNCTANCGVLAHVRNGRVLKIEGNPRFEKSEGALCAKGLSGIQALYNPNRQKYPMMRVGKRGENKWKRVTWDFALSNIAKKLMEIKGKYGAEAVFGSTGGGGNPNFMSICRFCNVFGTPNWFEPGAAQCYMPRRLMYSLTYGRNNGLMIGTDTSFGDSNYLESYDYNHHKMKAIVLWGTAPSYSGPAQAGRVLVELRARGVKTVVIDPRFTPDAAKADVWLPIRPGTDVALGLGWVRYIIANKLYDHEFVMKWTNLPYLVNTKTKMFLRESDIKKGGSKDTYVVWDNKTKSAQPMPFPWNDKLQPALEGSFTVNGTACKTGFQLLKDRANPWTLQKAAKTCWLKPEMIEKAIKVYAQTPSSISHGVATDQNPNSTQAAHITSMLNIIMGNVQKPGVALQHYVKGEEFVTSPLVKFLPEKQLLKRLAGIEYKGMLEWWTSKPSYILNAMQTGKPYKLKAWLERSGNKFGTVANVGAWEKAIHSLELIVHVYMYPTSFSAYADFMLPCNEWLETDFVVNCFNKMYARRATTHLFETVNESWYWSHLAKKCAELGHAGCKRAFDAKETAPEHPYFNRFEEQLDGWCHELGVSSWKEFNKKAPITIIPRDKWCIYYHYKAKDPKTGMPNGFGTPSKKCELYLESLITLSRTGQPLSPYKLPPASHDYDPLPFFMEPAESPSGKLAKQFPLVMTNGRLPFWHHLTLRNIPYLREIQPVADIWVNPADAKKYGVADKDWVWVESQRGKINARAYVSERIARGVVYMERFWNPELLGKPSNGFREMNVNMLSKESGPYNEVVGTYTLRGYLVKIYKASGAPKGIWQKPEQFEPWMPAPTDPTKIVELKS